jgi:chemotaxis protein MotB
VSARRARHEEHEEHENHERWLITYADMITLLMVLFIVMYAIGQTDAKKFESLKESLNKGFGGEGPISITLGASGVLEGGGPQPVVKPVHLNEAETALQEKRAVQAAQQVEAHQLAEAKEQITAALQAAGLSGTVQFRQEARGLVVTVVSDRVLFDSGSATLRPEGRTVLDGLAGPLRALPNHLAIEGHTDDRPVSSRQGFPTNWELSTARATSVLRYLLDAHHVPAERMAASGYADERNVVPNDNEVHRAQNRRVEIVVLAEAGLTPPAATPAPAAQPGASKIETAAPATTGEETKG